MSFRSEFESLIAEAQSSLHRLDSLVSSDRGSRQGQGNSGELGNKDGEKLRAEVQAVLASLQQIRRSYSQNQQRLSELERELTLDLENVRSCAGDYFVRGQYKECAGLLSFLGKIQPHDESLERFLDDCRRKQLELEAAGTETLQTNSAPVSKVQVQERTVQQASSSPVAIEVLAQGTSSGASAPKNQQAAAAQSFDAVEESSSDPSLPTTQPLAAEETELQPNSGAGPSRNIEEKRSPAGVEDRTPRARLDKLKRRFFRDRRFRAWRRRALPWAAAAGTLLLLTKALTRLSEQSEETTATETRSISEPTSVHTGVILDLREQAQNLYEAGKFQDADLICTRILSQKEGDAFALALRDTIRKALFEQSPEIERTASSEKMQKLPLLDSAPGALSVNRPSHPDLATAGLLFQRASQPTKPASAIREISVPRRMPPRSDVAGARQPASVKTQPGSQHQEPAKPVATLQTSNEGVLELTRRIDAQEFNQARVPLTKLENEFPNNSELKTHGEKLRAEEGKQQSLVLSSLQKAESALIVGHYVTPPDENALVYCNQTLKLDAHNRRASELKKHVVERAIAQAKDWIQRGKFDSARLYFASMDYLALNDGEFPYPKAELKQELQKLEFKSYPMVHEHKLGSCSGRLRINAYVISYVPSDDSGDGFTESLQSLVVAEDRDRLRISSRGRTFRFRRDLGRGSQSDDADTSLYRQFITLVGDEKSTPAAKGNKLPLQ